jgi:hypothetical protein
VRRVLLALAIVWACYFAIENTWIRMLPHDLRFQSEPVTASEAAAAGRRALAVLSLLVTALQLIWANRKRLWRAAESGRTPQWLFTAGSAWAIFVILRQEGFESDWYPLKALIENPGSFPIYGHRILFVWPAQLALWLAPGLGAMAAYLASQIVPIAGTAYLAGRLSALLVGESLAWIGQLLLIAFLCPTFGYYDCYDIAIAGFGFAMLLFLLQRRYAWFVLTSAVATLNHENALLWILAAAFAIWPEVPRKQAAVAIGSALALHAAVRLGLELAMPMPKIFDLRIWTNPMDLARMPLIWTMAVGLIAFRWCAALAFFPSVPPLVRRLAVLFPLLVLTTALFGQFHEARQFNASIPLEIAFVLYGVRTMLAERKFLPPAGAAA